MFVILILQALVLQGGNDVEILANRKVSIYHSQLLLLHHSGTQCSSPPVACTQYSNVIYAIFLSWPDNFLLELGDVMATNQAKETILGCNGDLQIVIKGSEQGIGVIFPHLPLNTVLQWMWIEL